MTADDDPDDEGRERPPRDRVSESERLDRRRRRMREDRKRRDERLGLR